VVRPSSLLLLLHTNKHLKVRPLPSAWGARGLSTRTTHPAPCDGLASHSRGMCGRAWGRPVLCRAAAGFGVGMTGAVAGFVWFGWQFYCAPQWRYALGTGCMLGLSIGTFLIAGLGLVASLY